MKRSSRFPVSVVLAYIAVIGMYLPVSILGFVSYGKDIEPNILDVIGHNQHHLSKVTVDIVLALITLHLMSSFVIVLNPVSQQFEEFLNIPQSKCFDWKGSSGWLESWEGLLLAFCVPTICAEAIFRVKWSLLVSWKFENLWQRFDWSVDRVTVGKPVMWLAVKTCPVIDYVNRGLQAQQ